MIISTGCSNIELLLTRHDRSMRVPTGRCLTIAQTKRCDYEKYLQKFQIKLEIRFWRTAQNKPNFLISFELWIFFQMGTVRDICAVSLFYSFCWWSVYNLESFLLSIFQNKVVVLFDERWWILHLSIDVKLRYWGRPCEKAQFSRSRLFNFCKLFQFQFEIVFHF